MMIRLPGVPEGTVLAGAGGMDMPAGSGGVHADLPGEFSLLLGVGEQPGVYVLPHSVSPETGEQVVDPPPRSVALMDITPGASGTDPEEDAVDQGSQVPGTGASPP